ncbi:hypothetical protein K4A83_18700 [Spirulina subsalsa FACHB-351]|uniref:Uncharacterized protein n=1 Tax=Spirulina subsalsa FACHB-351 TaxID=234711 RepID=A0ABT3L9U7_9CYAN|nr:hypothetical protein [Spirulina subsalsa]MCW6038288.1 hypothetical protein [Spirulina subsalsa FACHB-351]
MIEDRQTGDSTALLGLGALVAGTIVLPAAAKFGKPVLKGIIKSGLSLYQEAKVTPAPKSARSASRSVS